MLMVLSGEGVSDLGQCNNGQGHCVGTDFQKGAMTLIINQMLEASPKVGYSLLDTTPDSFHYISEEQLSVYAKKRKGRSMSLVGKHHHQETGYFYINAWMLAKITQEIETDQNDKAIAILFRDTDGTNSTANTLWLNKWQSMGDGFKRAEFERGVAMLPKPKSEAWLLCAIQNKYQHCAALEDLSGNDNAPNSAKQQLYAALNGHSSAQEVYDWLANNGFNADAVAGQMPSFGAFKDELERALNTC